MRSVRGAGESDSPSRKSRPCTWPWSTAFASARRLGGVDVTRDLLDHVIEAIAPRNVVLQIMPAKSEQHACLAGPIQLLETPDGQWRGYAEGQESGRLIADRKEVSRLYMRYARLRSQALSPMASVGLLEQLRGAL
ncbi:Scr1 family TA system antitoxin-like transcriptional regulator [Streptomyces sp. NPDC056224]|uniref:Scr1 family TA system antitoxin-like transcriptional regulator n=1 Tax=Streptomyces sp. NPDC056224 TaxID=3345750 RepID=UPI0035D8E960